MQRSQEDGVGNDLIEIRYADFASNFVQKRGRAVVI